MQTLKLEVGKTYRSRKGEEVRIVEKNRDGKYPYKGDNGHLYTESGRFLFYAEESPYDLIEEVPSETTRHTFKIPDDVKEVTIEQVGNRIVVEMVPDIKEPKPGDVMVNEKGSVYVYRGEGDSVLHDNYCVLFNDGKLGIGCQNEIGRLATPEEAKPLFDALKKAGKRWNPETMQVEDVPERERIMDYLQGCVNVNNVVWTYEQLCLLIEGYLKYREGEK